MMERWQWTALLLCGFGMFKEFRPSEPFFTEYLIEYKNVTSEDLIHKAYPFYTYCYLGTLAIVFLITDFVRYRPIIILEGLAYVSCWSILIWGQDLSAIYGVEFTFGLASSTEVAYYTYIYAKVDKQHYKKVTSYTYSAIFLGRFLGGVFAQILVSTNLMNYHELNYISLACVSVALAFSLFLPSVNQSIYFFRDFNDSTSSKDSAVGDLSVASASSKSESNLSADMAAAGLAIENGNIPGVETETKLSFAARVKKAYPILWTDFKSAYSDYYVIKWSLWSAIALAGHLQILNYIQTLWEVVAPDKENDIYNGAVEATQCGLSAVLAFAVGHIKIPWSKYGEFLLCIISFVEAASLVLMSQTEDLTMAYIMYVIFRVCFQVTITIASAEIAQNISENSYGLIFGVNTFVGLVLQTILTVIVVDEVGLALKTRTQFFVYGICYAVLGAMFVLVVLYSLLVNGCRLSPLSIAGRTRRANVEIVDGGSDQGISNDGETNADRR